MPKKEKKTLGRFFGSRWFLLTALVAAVLVAFGYARAYYQNYKVNQEIKSLQEQVRGLEHKKLESMEILKYVTSDAYVEEKARSELNLKKPGENVLIFKNLAESTPFVSSTAVDRGVLSNSIKWWYYFTHQPIPNLNN
jgi:cell division protein FtsL